MVICELGLVLATADGFRLQWSHQVPEKQFEGRRALAVGGLRIYFLLTLS